MKFIRYSLPPIVRNIEASHYVENFLVFSVVSIVAIRLFLKFFDYPELGGGGLHIAHMLWGGLLMGMALLIYFLFLNKALHQVASVLGGIGFGTFIDELGKFITADNDYFYQPTFALMYIVFVLVYLIYRFISKRTEYSQVEYLANALETTKEAVILDFDIEEKKQVIAWLKKADRSNRITILLEQLIHNEQSIEAKYSLLSRTRRSITNFYKTLVLTQWVRRLMVGFFLVQVLGYIVLSTMVIVWRNTRFGFVFELRLGFFGWGLIISTTVAITLLLVGFGRILTKSSRSQAYRYFQYSLLSNILLVTFFGFYFDQLMVFFNLVINLLFLKSIEYALVQERQLKNSNL